MNRRLLVLALCVAMACSGCVKKTGGVITPWERVTTENAVLAQLVDTSTQGTIAVQTSGLITAAQAAPILQYESQAATVQQQLTKILAVAPTSANIPQIQALVSQLGASAQALISGGGGALGIKNPNTQQAIVADIQAIVNSANLLLSSYQTATGGH